MFFDVHFLNGKFGKNVQHLMSGFKYVAKEFDVKDQSQAQVDLHHLKGDITSKKDVLLRFFDAKNEVVTTPFDHSTVKQEPVSKLDDQPNDEPLVDDQNYEAPMKVDIKNITASIPIPAVNPMEKQHLRPKVEAGDLLCFGKKTEPPEMVNMEVVNSAVALPEVNLFKPRLHSVHHYGNHAKLQSWVKLSRIKRNMKHIHLIMKKQPRYCRRLKSSNVLNVGKACLVKRLFGNRYFVHSLKIKYAKHVKAESSRTVLNTMANDCKEILDSVRQAGEKSNHLTLPIVLDYDARIDVVSPPHKWPGKVVDVLCDGKITQPPVKEPTADSEFSNLSTKASTSSKTMYRIETKVVGNQLVNFDKDDTMCYGKHSQPPDAEADAKTEHKWLVMRRDFSKMPNLRAHIRELQEL